jgi:hypothetical protein
MAISHKHQPFDYPEYISPLPADELIKIGTIKQSLYNEGVEKIQKRIDELDQYGLSLAKPEDKKYFSQEMDKFIRAVNESAAKTDFSVLPNVKNILSIGRPLESDPNILNAIESTKELQRRQEVLKSLKPGERSAANDDYFLQDAEEWLNDGKVGSKLASGKSYIPYTDVNAKLGDRIKNLKADTIKRLQAVSGGYMDNVTIEKLADKKVADFIQTELDERDRMQLQLDARYSLKRMGPENIQSMAIKDFEDRLLEANKSLVIYQEQYKKAKLMYETSPTAYNRQMLDAADEGLRDSKVAIESAQQNIRKFSDINQVNLSSYMPYYMSNYITSKARAYSYTKEEHDYQPDQIYMKQLEHNLASAREYQKYLYDVQLEREKEKMKGAKMTPSGQIIPKLNDWSKPIEGGVPTKTIDTKGGLAGIVLGNIDNNLGFLNQALSTTKKVVGKDGKETTQYIVADPGARKNLELFRKLLTDAKGKKGPEQLKAIYEIYDGFLGSKTRGSSYTQEVWDALYTMVTGQKAANVSPQQVQSTVLEVVVNPLKDVYKELVTEDLGATRIAVGNSLNPSTTTLKGMDFTTGMGAALLADDIVWLGTSGKYDPATGMFTPGSKTTPQEVDNLFKNPSKSAAEENELGTGS